MSYVSSDLLTPHTVALLALSLLASPARQDSVRFRGLAFILASLFLSPPATTTAKKTSGGTSNSDKGSMSVLFEPSLEELCDEIEGKNPQLMVCGLLTVMVRLPFTCFLTLKGEEIFCLKKRMLGKLRRCAFCSMISSLSFFGPAARNQVSGCAL